MALSASQHVDLLDTAIQALLEGGASSYSIGNRSVTKHDIAKLYEERRYWASMVERENGGSIRIAKMGRQR